VVGIADTWDHEYVRSRLHGGGVGVRRLAGLGQTRRAEADPVDRQVTACQVSAIAAVIVSTVVIRVCHSQTA
jgi:hypothetical protein